jgi:hypothetical protein
VAAVSERAETYLRLLAEAALRPAREPAEAAGRADRVRRAADVLVDAGVLDDAAATEILSMLHTALRVRGVQATLVSGRIRRVAVLPGPGRAVFGHLPAGKSAAGRDVPADDAWRVVPAEPGRARGSRLMALIVTADRVIAPATLRFSASAGLDELAAPLFADLTATDDAGTSYMISFTDGTWAGSSWTGTILLRPPPPAGASELSITRRDVPILTLRLVPAGSPPVDAPVRPVDDSPGERLLHRRAEALLGSLAGPSADPSAGPLTEEDRERATGEVLRSLGLNTATPAAGGAGPVAYPAGPGTGPAGAVLSRAVSHRKPDLAELVATLEGAGVLSPLSEVPAEVAALGQALGVPGLPVHGCEARLPARWAGVLAYYGRRHQPPLAPGTGSIGAVLPEIDGARFVVAGARTGPQGTVLHVVGRGTPAMIRPGQDPGFSWWARDEAGGWHLGVVQGWHLGTDAAALRLTLLPPLRPGSPGTASTLTVEVTGSAQQLTADLAVHW